MAVQVHLSQSLHLPSFISITVTIDPSHLFLTIKWTASLFTLSPKGLQLSLEVFQWFYWKKTFYFLLFLDFTSLPNSNNFSKATIWDVGNYGSSTAESRNTAHCPTRRAVIHTMTHIHTKKYHWFCAKKFVIRAVGWNIYIDANLWISGDSGRDWSMRKEPWVPSSQVGGQFAMEICGTADPLCNRSKGNRIVLCNSIGRQLFDHPGLPVNWGSNASDIFANHVIAICGGSDWSPFFVLTAGSISIELCILSFLI